MKRRPTTSTTSSNHNNPMNYKTTTTTTNTPPPRKLSFERMSRKTTTNLDSSGNGGTLWDFLSHAVSTSSSSSSSSSSSLIQEDITTVVECTTPSNNIQQSSPTTQRFLFSSLVASVSSSSLSLSWNQMIWSWIAKRRNFKNIISSPSQDDDDTTNRPNTNIIMQKKKKKKNDDRFNYALLIALYTLQGIPIGLSASIPFLIQQKLMTSSSSTTSTIMSSSLYPMQALFSFCSWPFSMKLLWAPLVDSIYSPTYGRRKSWLIPIQIIAGLWMIGGSTFMEESLGTSSSISLTLTSMYRVTLYFFILYFFMATQDIAVDGWAITMLSKQNRGKGPVCNSIGQNVGYLIAYVGFMAFNDVDMSERIWRPWLSLPSNPTQGLVTLGGFLQSMGYIMICMTLLVAFLKKEVQEEEEGRGGGGEGGRRKDNHEDKNQKRQNWKHKDDKRIHLETTSSSPPTTTTSPTKKVNMLQKKIPKGDEIIQNEEDDDTSTPLLGVRETYQQLWAISQLPAVRGLFFILLTYRFPTSLSDNVKLLKAMEFGLSKQTIAWLTPLILLPLAILVPIVANNKQIPFFSHYLSTPLQQFLFAYKIRVTIVPLVDMCMLWIVQQHFQGGGKPTQFSFILGSSLFISTALQAFVHNLQSNAQMSFFAQRVDPTIGGTYMTLLNTAANLGGTWPASLIMFLLGKASSWSMFGSERGLFWKMDAYFPMQMILCVLGVLWLSFLGDFVKHIEHVPPEAWRTQVEPEDEWMKGKEEEGKPILDSTKNR